MVATQQSIQFGNKVLEFFWGNRVKRQGFSYLNYVPLFRGCTDSLPERCQVWPAQNTVQVAVIATGKFAMPAGFDCAIF